MEFGLSEEQRLLADSIQRWASTALPPDTLQALVDGGEADSAALRQGLTDLGGFGVMVPEAFGGSGLGLLEAALVAEALGHSAAPLGFVSSAIIAPVALSAAAAEVREAWLPGIAAGEVRIAAGFNAASGRRDGAGVAREGDRVTGRVLMMLDSQGADAFILDTDAGEVVLVAADAVQVTPLRSIDHGRSVARIDLDAAPASVLGRSTAALDRVIASARIALAADTLGAASCMLERAVAYALERKQFDRVIGSFQAVKHLCAEMAADLEPCRALLWYAAHAAEAFEDEFALMACHAGAHLGEVGTHIARTATEVHGGMGFTHDMGLHYFFKRIGLNRQLFGDPDRIRRDAARLQGWAA